MARGRMLNKKISRDKRVAELAETEGAEAALLFTWMIAHLDREGRHDGDPAVVRGSIVPRMKSITVEDVSRYLAAMHELELIDWYESDGDRYISYPRFDENQIGLRKKREPESDIPPMPEDCRKIAGRLPEDCRKIAGTLPAEGKGIKGKGIKGKERKEVALDAAKAGPISTDKKSKLSVDVQTVWGSYREHHTSCAGTLKSSRKEYKLVVARLKDGFTVPELIQAIQGYHVNPFHCGENDRGTKYQGLDLIMRDSTYVQKGIGYASGESHGTPTPQGATGKGNKILIDHWINEDKENKGGQDGIYDVDDPTQSLLPTHGQRS